jgi:predicted DsbA family dithiol-disulfide isomerase
VVDGLQERYKDKVEFRILNVERDKEANALANSMGVTAVPTFIFVNSDGVTAGRIVGAQTEERFVEALDALR